VPAHPIQNCDCQADVRRFLAITSRTARMNVLWESHLFTSRTLFRSVRPFFNFAGGFFSTLPSACKLGLFVDFAGRLFDLAFHFVNGALDLILSYWVICFLLVVE